MKILLLSDNHGLAEEVEQVVLRHRGDVHTIIHCGDSELRADHPVLHDIHVVRGNCDVDDAFPNDLLQTVESRRLYVTHGHLYNVKNSFMSLRLRAEELQAHVVFFGHTHVATAFQEKGIVFINPGSLRYPRLHKEATYCICEWEHDQLKVIYYNVAGEEIDELQATFSL